ncbi:DedA family protein [Candidatus Wolfebacteria bacterium CG_4_10_14_0_8_um_filter_37_11]|uniref:DedA family protein n=1 Tax=Candidatus Wolfebacteria bacterium CG_4_10_14_0_8_um_filter_37_11 TaxID=1975062 RepID=A0A2M7Q8R6_9BACT|nr:MAG: DedA family protein [Candidatus Wolfebacteria bacterium CG_4_10_14_0_8_um_filter_37_11]
MISIILETISNFILLIIQKIGYLGVFFLMFLQSVNIPIPSEITMSFSGFLVQKEILNFWLVVLMGTFGNLTGSLISYFLASSLARNGWRAKYGILKILISDSNLQLAEKWFNKYGTFSIFFGRMIPVVSTFISFPAGLAKMKISVFSFLTFAGSFVWCSFLTYLGFVFGENWQIIQIYFRKFDYLILILIIAVIGWWGWKHLRKIQNSK